MEGFDQLIPLLGSSPVALVLGWVVYNGGKDRKDLSDKFDKLVESYHSLDKRLAVIENFVENRAKAA